MIQAVLYILSGVALYGGAHHLQLGASRTPGHPHVMHGIMYLLLASFALTSALTYEVESISAWLLLGKVTITIGLTLWATLAWFVAAYTHFKPRLLLAGLTALWTIHLIGNLASPFSLLYSDIALVKQTLPSGTEQAVWHTSFNPWWTAVEFTILISLGYTLYASYKLFQHEGRHAALALGSGLAVLLGTSLTDFLTHAQVVQLAYLAPFGFLVFLLVSSLYPNLQRQHRQQPPESAASYNMTFNLNPPAAAGAPVPQRVIEEEPAIEITHSASAAPFTLESEPLKERVTPRSEQVTVPEQEETAEMGAAESAEEPAIAKVPSAALLTVEPTLDQETLHHVSDNLIDIAVYATMAINRFKRGETDPEVVEALCKKVRTQAIKTRRIANQLSRPPKTPDSDQTS